MMERGSMCRTGSCTGLGGAMGVLAKIQVAHERAIATVEAEDRKTNETIETQDLGSIPAYC